MADNTHAIDNAKAWFESIREMVAATDHSEWRKCSMCETSDKCREQAMCDLGEVGEDEEDAIQRILESPLSVLVRGSWHPLGTAALAEPAEYEILLSTGAPALRIIGDLSGHGEPESAILQWQDWGTPWTDLHMSDVCLDSADRVAPKPSEVDAIMLSFASHFYFGE